jgi:hypothetical protein|tara:strand:+ start:156 stop:488 length:333 start_codon:yes stop_codon:yes gene_type:complete
MEEEIWMHRIRSLAEPIQKAEYEVFEAEANVKRLSARLKLEATAEGCKTVSAQEVYAENNDEMYQARLVVGTKKGMLSSLRVKLDAYKVGFEEWRTKMVNAREEAKRYGA